MRNARKIRVKRHERQRRGRIIRAEIERDMRIRMDRFTKTLRYALEHGPNIAKGVFVR